MDTFCFMIGTLLAAVTVCPIVSEAVDVSTFTETPANTAVVEGDSVQLNCTCWTNRSLEFHEWRNYSSSADSSGTRLSLDGGLVISSPRYTLVGAYKLKITNVEASDSGLYRCRLVIGVLSTYTYVIILEMDPVCGIAGELNPINTAISVNPGAVLEMECHVRIAGEWAPSVEWLEDQASVGSINASTGSIGNGYVEYVYTTQKVFQAADDGKEFVCRTFFDSPPTELAVVGGQDVPNYEHRCTVTVSVPGLTTTSSVGLTATTSSSPAPSSSDSAGSCSSQLKPGLRLGQFANPLLVILTAALLN